MRPWLSASFCPPLPEITRILLWGKAGTEACTPRRRAPGLVVGWEVAKAHYLSLPRVLCGPPPPSLRRVPGPRVLGVSAPCVEGVTRRLPLFGSSSSAVLSQLGRCLQNWKGAAEGGGRDRLQPREPAPAPPPKLPGGCSGRLFTTL